MCQSIIPRDPFSSVQKKGTIGHNYANNKGQYWAAWLHGLIRTCCIPVSSTVSSHSTSRQQMIRMWILSLWIFSRQNEQMTNGPRQAKMCLRACAKCTYSDSSHPCAKSHTGDLFSIHTFCSVQWVCWQTAKALIRLRRKHDFDGTAQIRDAFSYFPPEYWSLSFHSDFFSLEAVQKK